MMKVLGFALVMLAGSMVMGQTQQKCPVRIDKWRGQVFGSSSRFIHVHYSNLSNKPVSAIIFKAYTVDALGEAHDFVTTPEFDDTEKHPLKPTAAHDATFRYLLPMGTYGLWIYGVRFADGTTWKDDGSRSCSLVTTW